VVAKKRGKRKSSPQSTEQTALPGENPAAREDADPAHSLPFHIVCIGASAGGIEAVSALLAELSPDSGMAFVVVQHLDPKHVSMLAEILARKSCIPVATVENRMRVEPNHAYVIPPGKDVVIGNGVMQLSPRTQTPGVHRPIDHFLRSLAEDHGDKAIGVILSGMGSDGSLGIEEIKAAGGITFAQDLSAEQSSMPNSAVATGCIDMVMSPKQIAHEINRISLHPLLGALPADVEQANQEAFERIVETLRSVTGVDFADYKRNTVHRRITRRMVLNKFEDLATYAAFVAENGAEAEALYQDILINVTSFFRDPEAYELLKTRVFPELADNRARHDPIRVWVLGCSTGEEAYSIAMAYSEFAEATGQRVPLQIFATDLNNAGIERARIGIYAKGIIQDVSPERLRKFFIEVDGSYRIGKPIRDMCVFARQNVLADPPFSRMDLVACRNVLIYLDPELQTRLIPMLHYALRNHGFLWLGMSETIGSHRHLFEALDLRFKLYTRKPVATRGAPPLVEHPNVAIGSLRGKIKLPRESGAADRNREADRLLLSRYAPPAVVLTQDLEIVQFHGDTSPYIAPSPGKASLNLLKMLRGGLAASVRRAAQSALRDRVPVRVDNLRVRFDGGHRDVAIEAIPIHAPAREDALLLTFEERGRAVASATASADTGAPGDETEREIAQLREELSATRDYLQSVIEQHEATNEELQSANEEVQSSNEELQSINEELETSKEEIQSSNEELATVNDELQTRNIELTQSNNDLLNVLDSAYLPVVLLGRDLRIRRVTPAAEEPLNLRAADVGRSLDEIRLALTIPDLDALLQDALGAHKVHDVKVQDKLGRWFLVRIGPYRTLERKVEGVVLMLIDIDAIQRGEDALIESEARFALLANDAPVLIWVSDPDEILYANRALIDFLGADPSLTRFEWAQLIHPQDRDGYLEAYRQRMERREPFQRQVRIRRKDGQYRWMKVMAHSRLTPSGELLGYVGSAFDIGDLKDAERSLREADISKNRFLAVLGHELRNPLAAVHNSIQVLKLGQPDSPAFRTSLGVIERQTRNMVRMIDDLLDISRIEHGLVHLHTERVDLRQAIERVIAATQHDRQAAGQHLQFEAPDERIWVEGDPVRLEQVFSNLLVNASKFTLTGGHITVKVALQQSDPDSCGAERQRSARVVSIRVIDDGVGLSPEMVEQVFELFVQAESERSRASLGLGLGLPLTRQLVELHGGCVTARSEGPGRGVEFEVRLPVLADVAAATTTAVTSPVAGGGERVLIVDDNADAADVMKIVLELADYRTQIAYDGAQAIDCARDFQPHIVLLDIYLPDTTGWELAHRLRAEAGLDDALIIAVTGVNSASDRRRSAQAGIDRHLTKPVDMSVFWQCINDWKVSRRSSVES